MEGIFTTLGILRGTKGALSTRFLSLRDYLESHPRAAHFMESGEGFLGVRNAPAMVKAAVGAALDEGWESVLLATECDLTDFRAAFGALAHRLNVRTLPLYPNDAHRTLREAGPLLDQLGLHKDRTLERVGPWGAPAWNRPTAQAGYVLAGPPVGLTDLTDKAASLGWAPLWVEWDSRCKLRSGDVGQELCRFAASAHPRALLTSCRQKRLTQVPLILRTEPFCGHQMTEVWLREAWEGPVLVLESSRIGPLDAVQNLRLEGFLRMCAERGSSNGVPCE